jgi:hypothetical protein
MVAQGISDIWNMLNGFPPIVAFLLGLLGSYLVGWLGDERRDIRLRRATREALADELRVNLLALDALDTPPAADSPPHPDGSVPLLPTWALDYAVNPMVSGLLTDAEQTQFIFLRQRLDDINRYLAASQRERPSSTACEDRAAVDPPQEILTSAGRSLTAALVEVLLQQGAFASSLSMGMAEKLLPLLDTTHPHPLIVWRSSDIPADSPPGTRVVVWRQDAAPGWPLIALRPEPDAHFHLVTHRRGPTHLVRRHLQKRRIDEGRRRLAQVTHRQHSAAARKRGLFW